MAATIGRGYYLPFLQVDLHLPHDRSKGRIAPGFDELLQIRVDVTPTLLVQNLEEEPDVILESRMLLLESGVLRRWRRCVVGVEHVDVPREVLLRRSRGVSLRAQVTRRVRSLVAVRGEGARMDLTVVPLLGREALLLMVIRVIPFPLVPGIWVIMGSRARRG